jgi:hypothetical protein
MTRRLPRVEFASRNSSNAAHRLWQPWWQTTPDGVSPSGRAGTPVRETTHTTGMWRSTIRAQSTEWRSSTDGKLAAPSTADGTDRPPNCHLTANACSSGPTPSVRLETTTGWRDPRRCADEAVYCWRSAQRHCDNVRRGTGLRVDACKSAVARVLESLVPQSDCATVPGPGGDEATTGSRQVADRVMPHCLGQRRVTGATSGAA